MYNSSTVSVGTHDGIFHYDDLVSVSLLSILHNGKITLVRTRKPNILNLCDIVVDVGGGKFDHHMSEGNGKRKSGTPFASAGLVWQEFGEKILENFSCPKDYIATCKDRIDKELIEDLDKIDNGIKANSPFEYISYFLPNWNEADYSDACFMEALSVTCAILRKAIAKIIHEEKDKLTLHMALAVSGTENIIEIPSQFIKWQGVIIEHNDTLSSKVDFVIFPYPSGGYAAQCVPPSADNLFDQRIPFPHEWAGKTEKLPEISGVNEATFCHNGRFFVRATTRAAVIELCKIATAKFNK